MGKRDSLTPSVLVGKIRENQNNNKTLKSLFAGQFLGKFDAEELNGLHRSIEKELEKRQQKELDAKIKELESMGFEVKPKK